MSWRRAYFRFGELTARSHAETLCRHVRVSHPFAIVALCLIATGCESQKGYADLAELGSAYAGAVDRLLVLAGTVSVDATSERLLQDREIAPQTKEDYQKLSDIDVKRLALIDDLRKHVQLVANYFGLLQRLAGSDASDQATKTLEGTASSVSALGQRLRKNDLAPGADLFTTLTKIAVAGAVRGALKTELTRHGDTIRMELNTEEVLLRALSGDIKHDLDIVREIREARLVIVPFVASDSIKNYDEWMASRKAVLSMNAPVAELAAASTTLGKLREAFEGLMGGKLDDDRIRAVEGDFKTIIALTDTVKK
jgi:hypothetical protein